MSQGTPVVTLRMSLELKTRIEFQIISRNQQTHNAPWTFTDFMIAAAEEKLAKMARSRTRPVRLPPLP